MKCDLEVEELLPLEAHPAPVDVQCASILVNRDREWQMWSNDFETKIVKPALTRCQGGKGTAEWVARLRLGGPLPCHRSLRLIRLRFLPLQHVAIAYLAPGAGAATGGLSPTDAASCSYEVSRMTDASTT